MSRLDQIRSDQVRSGQIRSDQVRSDQTDQITSYQIKSGAASIILASPGACKVREMGVSGNRFDKRSDQL